MWRSEPESRTVHFPVGRRQWVHVGTTVVSFKAISSLARPPPPTGSIASENSITGTCSIQNMSLWQNHKIQTITRQYWSMAISKGSAIRFKIVLSSALELACWSWKAVGFPKWGWLHVNNVLIHSCCPWHLNLPLYLFLQTYCEKTHVSFWTKAPGNDCVTGLEKVKFQRRPSFQQIAQFNPPPFDLSCFTQSLERMLMHTVICSNWVPRTERYPSASLVPELCNQVEAPWCSTCNI